MGYFPFTQTGKDLAAAVSPSAARTTGLGISAAADSILDDASTDAILTTLGGGALGIEVFKDATAAAVRSDIGAGPAYVVEAKNADFIAASGRFYEIDTTSDHVNVTMFAIASGADFVGFKRVAGSNNVIINRNGTQDIDGAASKTLTVNGESIDLLPNAAVNKWLLK